MLDRDATYDLICRAKSGDFSAKEILITTSLTTIVTISTFLDTH